jgi:predicted ATPase/class 3 adenylate cyclase
VNVRQLVPNLILQNYIAGNFEGEFPAVGLFIDISGFSALTDTLMQHGQHGAEVLARIMWRVFGLPSRSIYEQGGFIVGYAGDAFTALFPLEGNSAIVLQQALAAAWIIQQRITAEPLHSTEYGDFPISAKVGLALGDTAWGILRSRDEQRATYYFRGAAINGSAAAEHRAKAGEIILAENIYNQLQDKIQVEAMGEYYRLTGIKGKLPSQQAIPTHPQPPQTMSVFFPEDLLYQDLRSEFRQAINLFISLPELPASALKMFLGAVFELQERYGGLFTRVDYGDKGCNILFFWGAPVAYENDAERALNFILDLRARVDFKFSVGVTSYISRAGFMGSEMMEEYTCYGWGINLAARLMLTAQRGEIWLDERVARRAENRFDVDYVGEQNFKGFAQKQKVFILRGRKDTPESLFQGVMVGRRSELKSLANFVSPLWHGRYAGSLTIWGDPGMGKSRLAYEFRVSPLFAEHKALWSLCQADQIVRESFNPFSYWLRRYFNVSESQDADLNRANFDSKLKDLVDSASDDALVAEINRTRSFLAALVDLYWPDSPYEKMDAQGRYDNTFIVLTALIKAESLRQPIILFVEDAQYLDDDSSVFIQSLMRSLKASPNPYPVAILSTSRREGAGLPLDQALLEQEIDLGGLSPLALDELAESILGNPPAADLLQLLEERADGNPFFVEQILRYLREESMLKNGPSGWSVVKSQAELNIPTDIKTLLIARLDQLTREVRVVIQTASILGREFEILVLGFMLLDDPRLPDEIAEAERASIWSALNEIRYIFKHALLRDAAYTMQMQARRRELHTLALESIEKVFAGRLDTRLGELAYHAEQANLVDKARLYLEQAGDQARKSFQNTVAADYYIRALAVTSADDLEAQFRLRVWLNDVYDQMGNRELQKQNLEQLRQIAVTMNDGRKLAEFSKLQTAYLTSISEYLLAADVALETVTLAQKAGDKEIEMRAYAYIATSLHNQGKDADAVEYAEAGLRLAREIGHLNGEAQQLNTYGLITLKLRDPETARARLERSLEIYRQVGNLRGETFPLSNLGWVYAYVGDYASAQDYYEKALTSVRDVGNRSMEGGIAQSLGWVMGLQGDFAQAIAYLERGLRLARETAYRRGELYCQLNLSAYYELQGNFDMALVYAEQALVLARELKNLPGEAWAQNYRGHALLSLKRHSEAYEAYQHALELNRILNLPVEATEPAAGLARIALERGDLSTAQVHLETILEQIDRDNSLSGTDQPLRVYHTCYIFLEAIQSERAKAVLEIAYQLLMARLNNIQNELLRHTFLENIPHHREILHAWNVFQNDV